MSESQSDLLSQSDSGRSSGSTLFGKSSIKSLDKSAYKSMLIDELVQKNADMIPGVVELKAELAKCKEDLIKNHYENFSLKR